MRFPEQELSPGEMEWYVHSITASFQEDSAPTCEHYLHEVQSCFLSNWQRWLVHRVQVVLKASPLSSDKKEDKGPSGSTPLCFTPQTQMGSNSYSKSDPSSKKSSSRT